MDFDYVRYIVGSHARERGLERIPGATTDNIDEKLQDLISDGTLLFDVRPGDGEFYRYFKSGEYFIPCVKKSLYEFRIMSILDWSMVIRNENTTDYDALQHRVRRYHYH
ncbi:hypothetical protein ACPA0F_18395 [Solibacillus silvestris]